MATHTSGRKPKKKKKFITLKGYIEQVEKQKYFAICLNFNLHVYGKNHQDAKNKLNKLIQWYIKDAIKNKKLFKDVIQRAPLRLYLKYYRFRYSLSIYCHIRRIYKFIETFQLQEVYA